MSPQKLYSQSNPYNEWHQDSEWFTFLTMLERDNLLHGKLVCCSCRAPHHATLFSASDLHEPPEDRSCLGYEDQKWICPHKLWTMDEIRLLRQGDQLKVFHHALWPVDPCQCLKSGLYLHRLFLAVKPDRSGKIISKVKNMLGSERKVPHQHLRLRDPDRECYQHVDCATLGRDGAKFECRWCNDDLVSCPVQILATDIVQLHLISPLYLCILHYTSTDLMNSHDSILLHKGA